MIIIHARGNDKIGIGNIVRCYELIKYLSIKHQVIGIFECNKELFLRYEQENIFRTNEITESINLIKKYKPNTYICDLVDPDKNLSDNLKEIGVKNILHFNGLEYGFEPDILFVTDSFDYEVFSNTYKIYRGFQYYIVGTQILKSRKKHFSTIENIKNILVCFGGADPAYFTEYFAEIIDDSIYNYTIVLGPAMSNERKEYIKSIKKINISYIDSPTNMVELLLNSDMLITLGGMTTYEAMCLGIPASAIRWSYLEYNVKSFGEKSMITDLGYIEEAYSNLLNLDITNVNRICKNAYDIIDGNSLKNIELIIDSLKENHK
jgi:spore coat polysaccharide biosynthesis predicted glycosyltransferase SpsG